MVLPTASPPPKIDGLAHRLPAAENTVGRRTGNHHAVVVLQHLSGIALQQGKAEETEKILLRKQDLHVILPPLHLGILVAHPYGIGGHAPVLYLRIAACHTLTQQIVCAESLLRGKKIGPVRVFRVLVHGELARHHVGDKEHEHQRNAQPRHIDKRKELVAFQKSKISFHDNN